MADFSNTIEIERGANEWLDVTATQDGAVQPITGWSLIFRLKRKLTDDDADAVITKSTAAGTITITDGTGGLASILFDEDDFDALNASDREEFWGGLRGRDGSDQVHVLWKGIVTVNAAEQEAVP